MEREPLLGASVRDIVRAIPHPGPPWTWRQGVVTAVHAGPPKTVDVEIGGVMVEDVRYLGWWTAAAGVTVWLVVSPDGAVIVLGPLA